MLEKSMMYLLVNYGNSSDIINSASLAV